MLLIVIRTNVCDWSPSVCPTRRVSPGDGSPPAGREDGGDGREGGGTGEDCPECRGRDSVALPGDEFNDDRRSRPRPLRAADRIPEDRAPVVAEQPDPGRAPAVERLPEFPDPDPEPPAVEHDLDDPAGSPLFIDCGAPAPLEVACSFQHTRESPAPD